jgi:hypothetical protein
MEMPLPAPTSLLPNHAARYAPIARWFEAESAGNSRWLEVGSGAAGLRGHSAQPSVLVGCDLRFSRSPHPALLPARANATLLPFADAAFDGVLSLDMLEHVAPQARQSALAELCRVSAEHLIVGYPSGQAAQRADRLLAAFYRWRKYPLPEWLAEHLLAPYPPAVPPLPPGWHSVRMIQSENWLCHTLLMILETRPAFVSGWRTLYAGRNRRVWQALAGVSLWSPYRSISWCQRDA